MCSAAGTRTALGRETRQRERKKERSQGEQDGKIIIIHEKKMDVISAAVLSSCAATVSARGNSERR